MTSTATAEMQKYLNIWYGGPKIKGIDKVMLVDYASGLILMGGTYVKKIWWLLKNEIPLNLPLMETYSLVAKYK